MWSVENTSLPGKQPTVKSVDLLRLHVSASVKQGYGIMGRSWPAIARTVVGPSLMVERGARFTTTPTSTTDSAAYAVGATGPTGSC